MDEDDIYGSILSDPKSNSTSTSSNNYNGQAPQYHQNQSQVHPQSSLFISNMTWWTSEDDLRIAFGDLSHRILQIQFLEHKPNGKSKGMVIVEFVDVATAELAKKTIEGREMIGKRVWDVSFARSAPMRAFERPYQARNEYNSRDQQMYNRPPPSRPMRNDQQFHHRPDRIQHEIFYEDSRNGREYQHQTRHVHREEPGFDQYQHYSRPHHTRTDSRDARSKSPDRRTSSSSHHYERRRY